MTDFSWLASEAKMLHSTFEGLFYGLVLLFLSFGVILEYFKLPLGKLPAFGVLVSRVFIATILMVSFPDVMNIISDLTESLSQKIGDLNQFKVVLSRMGEELDKISWSWISVKKSVIYVVSFLSFLILYMSVYLAEAFFLYAWTLCYIFSPLMIALYVFPQTSGVTKSLYRTIIEVSSWKVVWASLTTLLWSTALIDIEKLNQSESFITIMIFNIMLALSVLLTPLIVRVVLGGAGFSGMIAGVGAVVTGSVVSNSKRVKDHAFKRVKNQFDQSKNTNYQDRRYRQNTRKPKSSYKKSSRSSSVYSNNRSKNKQNSFKEKLSQKQKKQ